MFTELYSGCNVRMFTGLYSDCNVRMFTELYSGCNIRMFTELYSGRKFRMFTELAQCLEVYGSNVKILTYRTWYLVYFMSVFSVVGNMFLSVCVYH